MREDIFEGIKLAVSRGESLQSAMQSFYNSGYKKEEIEEAARALQMQQLGQPIQQTSPAPTTNQQPVSQQENKPTSVPEKPKGKIQQMVEKIIPFGKTSPGQPAVKESPKTLAIILLGLVLFLLLFALIGVLVFKKDIVSYFTAKVIDMFS